MPFAPRSPSTVHLDPAVACLAPCLVVEVLSDSTAAFDRGAKFAAYRQLPSLQEYLLVDIERQQLELFRREAAGWVLHEPEGEPRQLWLASVDLQLLPQDALGDLDSQPAAQGPEGAKGKT